MKTFFLAIWRWITRKRGGTATTASQHPTGQIRLHLPRSLRHSLATATAPRIGCPEPLALLRVRYAGEERQDIIVAVGLLPFPKEAYVEGDAGANFDTRWLMNQANEDLRINCGLMLVHRHAGQGPPEFSGIDRQTNREVMAPLAFGIDTVPYGAMVLSDNSQLALVTARGSLVAASVAIVPDAVSQRDIST